MDLLSLTLPANGVTFLFDISFDFLLQLCSMFQGCNVMAGSSLLPAFGKVFKYLKSQH